MKKLFVNEKNRMTKQKRLILEILRGTDTHPTADWIYSKAVLQMDTISRSTVYRNLNSLFESGLIQKINVGDSETRFDGSTHDHVHLVCDVCGRVIDLPYEKIRISKSRVEKDTGYLISCVEVVLHGVCDECNEGLE